MGISIKVRAVMGRAMDVRKEQKRGDSVRMLENFFFLRAKVDNV